MIVFASVALGINVLNLVICFINLLAMRRLSPTTEIRQQVNVLLPCRNEALRITSTLAALRNQESLHDWHLYLLDDRSEDHTFSLITEETSSMDNATVLRGEPLNGEWIGKSFALHQLLTKSRKSEFTVLIDADVTLSKAAIAQSISTLVSSKLDFLSIYPKQITRSWSEFLLQPLLQWTWLTTLLLRPSERSVRPSTTVANGQFMVIRTAALADIGGFSSVKNFVLDDIALARALKHAGHHGTVINGAEIIECRMYEDFRQLSAGYRKSLWSAFGSPISAGIVATLFAWAYIFPLPMALLGSGKSSALAMGALVIAIGIRVTTAITTRSPIASALFHPLAIGIFIYLLAASWIDRFRGNLSWSGRSLSGAQ